MDCEKIVYSALCIYVKPHSFVCGHRAKLETIPLNYLFLE